MHNEEKINSMIQTTMKSLCDMIEVNTIIGKPYKLEEGKTVIPVCKVTLAYLTGGGEYGKICLLKKDDSKKFSGGSGAIVNIKPSGFFVDDGSSVKFLQVKSEITDKVIDTATNIFNKLNEDE